MHQDFTTTPIYNTPALRYSAFLVPLFISDYRGVTRAPKPITIGTIPSIDITNGTNLAFRGTDVGHGPQELPKLTISGFIDTPTSSSTHLPVVYDPTGKYVTYSELIAQCFEGRYTAQAVTGLDTLLSIGYFYPETFQRVDPLWYRDPYGRVYTEPRIIDFQAAYVEAVPGRTTYTLVMQI